MMLLDTLPLAERSDIDDFGRAVIVVEKYFGRWAIGDQAKGDDTVDDRQMAVEAGVWPILVTRARQVVLLSKPPEVRVTHTVSMYPDRGVMQVASMTRVGVKTVKAVIAFEKFGFGAYLRGGHLSLEDAYQIVKNGTHQSLREGRVTLREAIRGAAGFVPAGTKIIKMRQRCSECGTGLLPDEPQCVHCGQFQAPRVGPATARVLAGRPDPRKLCSRCGVGTLAPSHDGDQRCLSCGNVDYASSS